MPDKPDLTSKDVVAAARSLVGRRWSDKARSESAVDCVGLIIVTARKLGIVDDAFDINGYGRQTDREKIVAVFRQHMPEIRPAEAGPGDVLLIRDRILPTHCGIQSIKQGRPHLIHAYARVSVRRVVEEPLDLWQDRVTHAFRFPGVIMV